MPENLEVKGGEINSKKKRKHRIDYDSEKKGLSRSISLCHKWKQARGDWMPTCPARNAEKDMYGVTSLEVIGKKTRETWNDIGEERRLVASIDLPPTGISPASGKQVLKHDCLCSKLWFFYTRARTSQQ
jgi:hypothetical protein